ncbi:MAG TPA: hypothetical protein VI451_03660 [Anaerolineales bacterium]|nr:hypothetical protein [Anaerolineales bacterium]
MRPDELITALNAREPENLERLVKALEPFHPVFRPNPHLEFNFALLQENGNRSVPPPEGGKNPKKWCPQGVYTPCGHHFFG